MTATPVAGEPLRVLFVCTANICRSPVMELTARAMAGEADIEFGSAGTHGNDGDPINPEMAGTIPAGQGDDFRSRRLTRELLERSDLVLTAEASHRARILEEHPQLHRRVFTLGQFATTVSRLPELSGRELVVSAGARRSAPRPAEDVADPYRRGAAAATEATGTISSMLGVVVPRLVGDR